MERGKFEDRRRHRIFVTARTEYHVRGDTVIAMRDRETGTWQSGHAALGSRLTGAVRRVEAPVFLQDTSWALPGDCLCLTLPEGSLLTAKVLAIKRPTREITEHYPAE